MNSHQLRVVTLRTRVLFTTSIVAAFFFIIGIQSAAAQTPGSFSTTWQTDNPGTSSSTAITIPTTGGTYNYTVYWEEVGTPGNNGTSTGLTGDATIDLPSAGTYRVDITGDFPQIYFSDGGDKNKILTIEQWGSIAWANMSEAFKGASNLTYNASDAPDLSGVTNMDEMFATTDSFTGDLDSWDVSNVTNMTEMFKDATSFNGTLNGWGTTTASVTTMSKMFNGATSFNQPLDTWDVSSTTNMLEMFKDATSFNGTLNGWGADTAAVESMTKMFNGATSFNQPLDSWDVSSVTSMFEMFKDATSFNGTLNGWGATTASVTVMSNMFNGATSFNQPLDTWDVSSVEGMTSMFYDATTFNQPLNAWGTNTAAVIYMTAMFSDATNFNQPLDTWDVSSVKGMSSMFNGASAFNRALNAWGTTTASVDTMNAMFFGATSFNQDLDTWDVSSTTDMDSMFEGATNFNGALNGWGTTTASVVDMAGMFLSATNFNQPLDTWDIGALEPTGLNNAFDDTDWSQENYSATLIGWNAQGNTPDDIELETAAKYLSSAEAARASLIADNTWTITDGGLYVAPSSGGSSGTRTGGRSSGGGSSDTVATETLSEREELLARIMELQQLIMQLQSQAGAIVTPGSATASCTFTRDLTTGSNGEDVTCLQTYLMSTGDYTYADGATGYFGSVTKAAVQSWQTKNGVFPAAGYFGPISQRAVKQ